MSVNHIYNNQTNGYIQLIMGPMFSGKTSFLKSIFDRFTIARKKCLMVKYINDNRYDDKYVITHTGIKCTGDTIKASKLEELDKIVNNYEVICIDEIQFYNDAPQYCDKWANEGLIIICAGLSGTFERKEFPIISKLIPLCEKIELLRAVCPETGNDATFSYRISDSNEIVDIGGSDKYKAVDRITYNNLINQKINEQNNK